MFDWQIVGNPIKDWCGYLRALSPLKALSLSRLLIKFDALFLQVHKIKESIKITPHSTESYFHLLVCNSDGWLIIFILSALLWLCYIRNLLVFKRPRLLYFLKRFPIHLDITKLEPVDPRSNDEGFCKRSSSFTFLPTNIQIFIPLLDKKYTIQWDHSISSC